MERLTVGKLRAALEGVPDGLEVRFGSDTVEDYKIVLEMVCRVTYNIPGGTHREDYFEIYGNVCEEAR